MNKRAELQADLEKITPRVYYQPGPNIKLEYPCIVYKLYNIENRFANNKIFTQNFVYELTFISATPDWDAVEKTMASIPYTTMENQMVTDNLYHTILHITHL